MLPAGTGHQPVVPRGLIPGAEYGILAEALQQALETYEALKSTAFGRWEKSAGDPVTEIDLALDALLKEHLTTAFPDDGWLSEESADSPDRLTRRRVWIVDPLDGTRELLAGRPEFCVSVALAKDGRVVLGAVMNLETRACYLAARGHGAWKGASRLRLPGCHALEGSPVYVSRRESREGRFDGVSDEARLVPMGGMAHKLACVAEGEAVGTITPESRHEWDVAAGALLVEEAGGRFTDAKGETPLFNRPDPILHGLVASDGPNHAALLDLCARVRDWENLLNYHFVRRTLFPWKDA